MSRKCPSFLWRSLICYRVVYCTLSEQNMGNAVVYSNPTVQSCLTNFKGLAPGKYLASGKRLNLRKVDPSWGLILAKADRPWLDRPGGVRRFHRLPRPTSFRRVSFCYTLCGTSNNDRNILFHAKSARTRESGNKHAKSPHPLLLTV
jgi:hypothetical protein